MSLINFGDEYSCNCDRENPGIERDVYLRLRTAYIDLEERYAKMHQEQNDDKRTIARQADEIAELKLYIGRLAYIMYDLWKTKPCVD